MARIKLFSFVLGAATGAAAETARFAREVEGVGQIESLLHLPGTPAPMKS
ncbi:MAG: hypothetical protein WD993_06685 [Thermoleophilaceae bacterium]